MVALGVAKQVSPLIRFARWTALITGVLYGYNRYNFLAKREIDIQKHENEIKEKYAQKKAAADAQKMKAEMDALGKEAGIISK